MRRLFGLTLAAAALAFGVVTGTAAAMAHSSSTAGANAAAELPLSSFSTGAYAAAEGCHRMCERHAVPEWGGIVRWHRHVGAACRPIHCTPH